MCFIYEQDVQDDTHGVRNFKGRKPDLKIYPKYIQIGYKTFCYSELFII